MSSINTHGINIKGLRKASGKTMNYIDPTYYDEIFFDRSTGEVWTEFHASLGHNEWTEFHDPDVVKVGSTDRHLTMQEIADMIADAVKAEA